LITEAMKNYALEKLSKIERFHTHIMDVHVFMDIQKLEHLVSIVLKFEHFKIKVLASSSDMYASIDKAVDKLCHQLSRWKSRIQDHNKKRIPAVDIPVSILNRPYDDELDEFNLEIEQKAKKEREAAYRPHKVIGKKTLPLKILSLDEAIMKMELSGDHFLLFKGEEEGGRIKVIYRRSDGNYGIIEPR
jgi:putative sigma-54 modulation protein